MDNDLKEEVREALTVFQAGVRFMVALFSFAMLISKAPVRIVKRMSCCCWR